jgi:carbonic anhydrase
MKLKHAFLILTALLTLFVIACSKTGEQAQEQTKASEPKTREVAPHHEDPHWSYEGEAGPANWGTLSAKWSPCGEGKSQSPIDIDQTMQAELPEMRANFKPAQLKIIHHTHIADAINNGHTVQVNYTEGDMLSIGEEQFQLLQYHFHSPSEHTVGGKHYPMEMHMVHKSAEGKLAVVGVFIEEGQQNAAFDPIWSNLPKSKGTENHFENVTVDVSNLLPASTTTYRYDGSLTTPPCSEGVKWIIMTTPIQLSAQQIGAFQDLIKGNNRPVQPLHGRSVVTDRVAESGMN